jgi:cation diffusion facilitator family transporter
MAAKGGTKAVVTALLGNLTIAAFKYFAAYVSSSSSMLAEGHHSLADTANQVLLLVGIHRSRRGPSARHPFGMGKAQFFWAFVVALVLFGVAGGLSIKGGIAKVLHPEPLENVAWSYIAIAVGVFFDGLALRMAYKALRERMAAEGETSLLRAFRDCTDATIITVLMEDALALAGLVVAGIAITVSKATGWWALDGYASILIGAMLMVFAFLLAMELKSMLLGEGLSSRAVERIKSTVAADPRVRSVVDVRTLVLGADEALVAVDVVFEPDTTVAELEAVVDRIEARIREVVPGARCYIEAESLKVTLQSDGATPT